MNLPSAAGVVRCVGDLDLRTCEATHAALLNALAAHDAVVIDCTGAANIDASFIQLLLAARASALARGRSLRLAEPAGGALLEVLSRGGFLDPDHPDPFWAGGEGGGR